MANPQIVIAVTLNDTCGGTAGYGGPVAAPVFREVAMSALRMLDVPKDLPDTICSSNERRQPVDRNDLAIAGFGRIVPPQLEQADCILRHSAAGSGRRFHRSRDASDASRRPFLTAAVTGAKAAQFSGNDACAPCWKKHRRGGCRWRLWGRLETGLVRDQKSAGGGDSAAWNAGSGSICKMTLGQVLEGVKLRTSFRRELALREIAGIDYDSRRVGKDFLFFAFAGSRVDGRRFAQDAVARGAPAVVSELAAPDGIFRAHGSKWSMDARRWLPRRAISIDGRMSGSLFTGITGTNGKTTTSYLIDAILREAGFVTGVIGTIEYRLAGETRRRRTRRRNRWTCCGWRRSWSSAAATILQWKFRHTPSRWEGSSAFRFTPQYSRISPAIISIFTTRWTSTRPLNGCCSPRRNGPC